MAGSWQVIGRLLKCLAGSCRIGGLAVKMIRLLASGFVVDQFGDLQIYNQNRNHDSSKHFYKSMLNLLKLSLGASGGLYGSNLYQDRTIYWSLMLLLCLLKLLGRSGAQLLRPLDFEGPVRPASIDLQCSVFFKWTAQIGKCKKIIT